MKSVNNFVRHGLLQNHVLSVRWVLFQAVPFLFFIAIWRFILGRSYKRYVPIQKRNTSRNGGENLSAELDEKYENAWHSVA